MTAPLTFRLSRWGAATAFVLTVISMAIYPGGTWRDPSTNRYSFTQNSLSDLGAHTAWNGMPNRQSATLFAMAFGIGSLAAATCFVALIPVYSSSRLTRWLARAAGLLGIAACGGVFTVALVAEDTHPEIHNAITRITSLSFVGMLLLFAVASALARRFRRTVPLAWLVLALLVAGLIVIARRVASGDTDAQIAMTLQKVVAGAMLAVVAFQSHAAERSFHAA